MQERRKYIIYTDCIYIIVCILPKLQTIPLVNYGYIILSSVSNHQAMCSLLHQHRFSISDMNDDINFSQIRYHQEYIVWVTWVHVFNETKPHNRD